MATAQFSGQYGHNMMLEVTSGFNKQDVPNNRSVVNVDVRLKTNGYASMHGVTADLTIRVNGATNVEHPSINIGTNSSQFIYAHDYVVPHNSDGTKTVNIQVSLNLNTAGYGSSTVEFNLPLATIPRASTVNDVTGTIGSAMTININRKNSAFKHTVKYNFGALSGTIATNVDTSVSWTPPLNLATAMPNKTSDWGNITVETYSGSSKIGSATCRLTLSVPDSVKPTLDSIALTDSNAAVKNLLNTANTFVQVMSNIQVAFNGASGAYGSTISSYQAEIVGKNQNTNSNNGFLGMMNFNGAVTIRAIVTDSRGRTSDPVDVKATVLDYFTPQISFTAQRSGSESTTVTVTRNAKVAPLTIAGVQKNKMKLTFKYKEHSSATYTADTGSANGTWTTISSLTNSSANLGATFSVLKTYDVIGTIEDSFTSYEYLITIGTDSFPLALRVDRVGLGKLPEQSGTVDSDWQYYFNNKPIQHHQLTSNDGRSPYNASGTVDLNTKTVNSFFSCNEPTNGPTVGTGLNQFYVSVYSESDNYLSQQAIQKNSGRMFTRTRQNGTWTNWIEYAPLNSVAEFTAVNQTKVYSATLAGPYGFGIAVTRSGNIVTATMEYVHSSNTNWNGKASETIPVGWRPVNQAIIYCIGEGGGGTGATLFNGSYVRLSYKPDGSISGRIKLESNPLLFAATISWVTTDPFPS
ncbi:DUF859 domain-containing protein [Streptococcus infantarius]|uniref:DUF859 family phage minor structural protein n=1 Tax=Streptococcus infantarius TaxID=102684 RepID=UPI002284F7B1|nr:DUF859 family phage minor structural protein [Streptococcus infantarius]MCY7241701.1 DUF859 domain-containing protein [Streptococcus infantarius]